MIIDVNQFITHNDDELWDFEVLPGCVFENANRIHPLKQKDVNEVIKVIKNDFHIIGMIVFGSSVRFDCHSLSDLDILIIRDDLKMTITGTLENVQSDVDIIFSSKLGDRLKKEIARTGVIVYRR